MEERVIRLQGDVGRLKVDVAEMRADVGRIKVDLATLTERVAHLPTKGLIVGSAVSTIAAITGLLVLLQRLGVLH